MTKSIRQLYNLIESPFLLDGSVFEYPTIEGNTSNFISDYEADASYYDNYFIHEYGDRKVDLYAENDTDAIEEFTDELKSILRIYLDSWARLYYALSIDFNPIYNVEEHTETTYGEHTTDHSIGERRHTEGSKQKTFGGGTDTSTAYQVANDALTERETGKTTDQVAQRVNSELGYTNTEAAAEDSDTSLEHTDTIDRAGNIGTVSATELLDKEIRLRNSFAFFKSVFLTIITEVGAYYESDFIR